MSEYIGVVFTDTHMEYMIEDNLLEICQDRKKPMMQNSKKD